VVEYLSLGICVDYMKPAWLKINEQWQAEGHFGLTIPFLLGALQQWQGQPFGAKSSDVEQMRKMLDSIRDDTPDGIVMRLYTCERRHELILAPFQPRPDLLASCIPVPSAARGTPALYVEKPIVADDADLFDALVSELWRRYGKEVQAGFFSLQPDGVFHPFNDDDRRLIRAAAMRPDDD